MQDLKLKLRQKFQNGLVVCRDPGGGGGGGVTSICMNIGYVPQTRPPFSAMNFRSGAYHFHKFPKIPFRSITILHFFNFNPFIASHGRLSPYAAPRVSQTRPGSSGESHFQRRGLARRVLVVPESPIFSTAG